jgi:hypothetical protein
MLAAVIILQNQLKVENILNNKIVIHACRFKKTWKLGKLVSGTSDCFQEPSEQTRS